VVIKTDAEGEEGWPMLVWLLPVKRKKAITVSTPRILLEEKTRGRRKRKKRGREKKRGVQMGPVFRKKNHQLDKKKSHHEGRKGGELVDLPEEKREREGPIEGMPRSWLHGEGCKDARGGGKSPRQKWWNSGAYGNTGVALHGGKKRERRA